MGVVLSSKSFAFLNFQRYFSLSSRAREFMISRWHQKQKPAATYSLLGVAAGSFESFLCWF
jgi:hypothetical protein